MMLKLHHFLGGLIGDLKSLSDFLYGLIITGLLGWAGIYILSVVFQNYPAKLCGISDDDIGMYCVSNPGFWSWFFISFQILLAIAALTGTLAVVYAMTYQLFKRFRKP